MQGLPLRFSHSIDPTGPSFPLLKRLKTARSSLGGTFDFLCSRSQCRNLEETFDAIFILRLDYLSSVVLKTSLKVSHLPYPYSQSLIREKLPDFHQNYWLGSHHHHLFYFPYVISVLYHQTVGQGLKTAPPSAKETYQPSLSRLWSKSWGAWPGSGVYIYLGIFWRFAKDTESLHL